MCEILHRLARSIVPRSCLPDEWDWDASRSFDFDVGELFSIPDFRQKTEFRAKALKVARVKFDVERERGKKAKSDAVEKTVLGESFNPFITTVGSTSKMWRRSCRGIPCSNQT